MPPPQDGIHVCWHCTPCQKSVAGEIPGSGGEAAVILLGGRTPSKELCLRPQTVAAVRFGQRDFSSQWSAVTAKLITARSTTGSKELLAVQPPMRHLRHPSKA